MRSSSQNCVCISCFPICKTCHSYFVRLKLITLITFIILGEQNNKVFVIYFLNPFFRPHTLLFSTLNPKIFRRCVISSGKSSKPTAILGVSIAAVLFLSRRLSPKRREVWLLSSLYSHLKGQCEEQHPPLLSLSVTSSHIHALQEARLAANTPLP